MSEEEIKIYTKLIRRMKNLCPKDVNSAIERKLVEIIYNISSEFKTKGGELKIFLSKKFLMFWTYLTIKFYFHKKIKRKKSSSTKQVSTSN